MKDLLLWRLMQAEPLDPGALAPLLQELAARPIGERWPFFAFIGRAVDAPAADLRAAAVATLAGAKGPLALPAIVARLDDGDERVRMAAVAALRDCAVGHPEIWAHALFHPRPDVRLAAVTGEPPPGTRAFEAWLLANPVTAELVRPRVTLDGVALPAMIDFVRRGVVAAEDARRWIAAMLPGDVVAVLEHGQRRPPEMVDAILASGNVPDEIEDSCDVLVELFSTPDADPELRRKFFSRLGEPLLKPERLATPLPRRLAASVVAVARQKGVVAAEGLGLACVHHPQVLALGVLPREARHGAAATLYDVGVRAPRRHPATIEPLVRLEVAKRGSRVDPWFVGALAGLLPSNPFQQLLEWFDVEELARAVVADLGHAAPLFSLPDDGPKGRGGLIAKMVELAPDRVGEIFAHLAIASATDHAATALDVPDDQIIQAIEALLEMPSRPGAPLSTARIDRVATLLANRLVYPMQLALPLGATPAAVPESLARDFLLTWLSRPDPIQEPLALAIFGRMARDLDAEAFVALATGLRTPLLRKLLDALPHATAMPYGKEVALAHALVGHVSPAVEAWAVARVPAAGEAPPPPPPRPPPSAGRAPIIAALSATATRRIATCAEMDLEDALQPALAAPEVGLAAALGARPVPTLPIPTAGVALLGCHDPIEDVSRELHRFVGSEPRALGALDAGAVRIWANRKDLPLHGNAWLWRWESHCFAAAETLITHRSGFVAALEEALRIPSPVLRRCVWDAAAVSCSIWRWRDKAKLAGLVSVALVDLLVHELDSLDCGFPAATMVRALYDAGGRGGELVAERRAAIAAMLPDLATRVREQLAALADATGLPAREEGVRSRRAATPEEMLANIRGSTDLELLARACRSADERLVHESAVRLIVLGETGLAVLLRLIDEGPPAVKALVESVTLWPDGAALEAVRARVTAGSDPPELRFRLALALLERGDPRFVDAACAAACVASEMDWLRAGDYQRLVARAPDRWVVSVRLAVSPYANAYRPSVEHLLSIALYDGPAREALAAFLEIGSDRLASLRLDAAMMLHRQGSRDGYPLLIGSALASTPSGAMVFAHVEQDLVLAAVEAVLHAGHNVANEPRLVGMIDQHDVDHDARDAAFARLLTEMSDDAMRAQVVRRIARKPSREAKLRNVAEIFAWGTRIGRELTSRVLRVHMTSGGALGWTRLGESKIWVTPLPVLRGERHGTDLVEALVLHEIGHHVHHRGEAAEAVWHRADKEGIGGLLNLVADEHLERNLRAYDSSYGDRLKRLAAWAFQHSRREIPLAALLDVLGGRAFEVLSATPLAPAREPRCVAVDNGALLTEMERAGLSFARFVRSLRMGLGDRHGDPKVRAGLDLFKSAFRKRDMQGLLDVSHALRDIFGWEVKLVECMGTHETLKGSLREGIIHGEGIDDGEVQDEVERILDPRQLDTSSPPRGGRRRLAINVADDEKFEPITRVEKVPYDPVARRTHADRIKRHATAMRRVLQELGLNYDPKRFRLRGRRFDPTRTRAVVTRGDPRMLIARERVVKSDLFLGVIVDCSGSMHGESIERARLFATLLAEAARGLPGVDVRVFGFTHEVIWDAGDAARCAAASLEADGGNNDAAALHYVAGVAKASLRKAKLLVMISDGLPTECSVAALRGLVQRLTRREMMCCAQVAVRPLEEICFPHYVLLEEAEIDPAVRRFGVIVTGLVRRALSA